MTISKDVVTTSVVVQATIVATTSYLEYSWRLRYVWEV